MINSLLVLDNSATTAKYSGIATSTRGFFFVGGSYINQPSKITYIHGGNLSGPGSFVGFTLWAKEVFLSTALIVFRVSLFIPIPAFSGVSGGWGGSCDYDVTVLNQTMYRLVPIPQLQIHDCQCQVHRKRSSHSAHGSLLLLPHNIQHSYCTLTVTVIMMSSTILLINSIITFFG